jgi:hypothetical protein
VEVDVAEAMVAQLKEQHQEHTEAQEKQIVTTSIVLRARDRAMCAQKEKSDFEVKMLVEQRARLQQR